MQARPATLLPATPGATPVATLSAVFLLAVLTAGLALASVAQASDAKGAPGPAPADLLLLNGYVYTSDPRHSVAEAVAVNNGLISAVGSSAELKALQGPDTKVIDLGGRMLLPGLHDVHMHVFGIVEPDVCSLQSKAMSLEEMVPYLQECVRHYQYKPGAWMSVEMWDFSTGNQISKRLPSLRAALDAVSTDNPIILWGNDGHHGAVNSRALELARDPQGQVVGMNAETMTKQFASIRDLVGLDENGEPNGELNEGARQLLGPPARRDPEVLGKLLPDIQRVLASNGITSIQDASLNPSFLPYLKNFENSGAMRFRMQVATRLVPEDFTDSLTGKIDIDQMMAIAEASRESFRDSVLVHPTAVKIYADGVLEGNPFADPPTLPNGAVLESYRQPRFHYDEKSGTVDVVGYVDTASPVCVEARANPERFSERPARDAFRAENGFHPSQCNISFGVMADPEPFIMEYVRRLDAAGFTIHIHAIGDRAVRAAVDALAQVVPPGSGNPKRHAIAHLQLVHPDDQKRIGEMGLYLAWTYAWMLTNPAYDMTVMPFIGDVTGPNGIYDPESYRMKNSYPVRSIMNAGGVTVAGSDAPVEDRSPRPFINMALGVTRQGTDGKVLNADETIDIHQMIAAYTINGARALKQEAITGSIEVGKKADMAVLDRNIVEMYDRGEGYEIAKTKVDLTFFEGELIYQRQ